jgi:hypothetical protein
MRALPSLRDLASATPPTRDRYVDFLRAASIVIVVAGHWLISLVYWTPEAIGAWNVIGLTPFAWFLTWLLMIMPVFFFVGGFSNDVSLQAATRRGEPVRAWLRTRLVRLLKPSAIFIGVWVLVEIVLHLADACGDGLVRCVKLPPATVPFGPIWFLGVYMGVVLLAPVTLRLHRRFRWKAVAAFLLLMMADDLLAFGAGWTLLRWPNGAWVWLMAHQLGYFYADGTFDRLPRRAFGAMAAAGFAALVALTGIGVYPRSLIGTDLDPISNANPPTLPMAAQVFWMTGAVMLLRPLVTRWLRRPRVWMATIYLNSVIMTLFLWHMTAFLLAMLVLMPLGFGLHPGPTAAWWLERPLWILVSALFLAGLVAVFGRFERPRTGTRGATRASGEPSAKRSDFRT